MTKRTSDELSMETTLETTADVRINGNDTDANDNNNTIVENNNEIAKKVKYENQKNGSQDPNLKSRVVHVRNIPADTQEADLYALSAGFGRVTNCLVLRGKSQAFIEFSDASSAQQMVNYWLQTTQSGIPAPMQPTIRGRHVFCQLSNHKELKTNNNHVNGGDHQLSSVHQLPHDMTSMVSSNGGQQQQTTSREPTCVLRVIVENLMYSVSLEILHSVFSRAGKVAKIVTFTKNGSFQALIQYETPREAQTAKQLLDGQCLFHHANTLRIEFSKLTMLNVKYNNDKSRDYTNPALPAIGQQEMDQSLMSSLLSQQQNHSSQQMFNPFAVNQTLRALNPLHALNALQSQSLGQLGAHLGLGGGLSAAHNGLTGGHGLGGQQSAVLLVSNLNESVRIELISKLTQIFFCFIVFFAKNFSNFLFFY